ncbi:uncharacterized protein LOC134537742 [Bacillus rossius redtenbacheri]|uniref:uncharacterized protein LOC134537742 n=1 Tax=Bacillus rossius redtenbacheri TaxID=93214 RepID=UPI002FDE480E
MSSGRIQRLLYTCYWELEDFILVESPFAETTASGRGLHQVYLGLTQSHLIVAADMIRPAEEVLALYCCGVDPCLEDFELISIYPLMLVHISAHCLRKKHVLKVHFCNNVVRYFELGGSDNKKTHWRLWREHVRFLSADSTGYSQSETSACSTASRGSVCLASSAVVRGQSGRPQLWQQFRTGGRGDQKQAPQKVKWPQKEQFFGTGHEKLSLKILETLGSGTKLVYKNEHYNEDSENDVKRCSSSEPCVHKKQVVINRFGSGIPENCTTALTMRPVKNFHAEHDHKIPTGKCAGKKVPTVRPSASAGTSVASTKDRRETSARAWSPRLARRSPTRHPRRYALEPLPFLCSGLGLLQVIPGDRYTIQVKRVPSAVAIAKPSACRLQPRGSASCEGLGRLRAPPSPSRPAPVVLFWTPGFSYRPAPSVAGGVRRQRAACSSEGQSTHCQDKHDIHLLNALRNDLTLSSWEFDSQTFAYQLTIIDRNLFLRLPATELEIVLQQRSSKNAFNIRAAMWFSTRVASLVTSQILDEKSRKVRARLMCRYIDAGHKCYSMNNFQSCRNIVAGLQSPSVYRLHQTWAVVRRHHASRYRMFARMCRHYSGPPSRACREELAKASAGLPLLPHLGGLLARLLTGTPVTWRQASAPSPLQQVAGEDSSSFFEPVLTDSELNEARLLEVTQLLVASQKAANLFQFPTNKIAQSFLLKARYREDVYNFLLSAAEDNHQSSPRKQ